MSRRRDAGLTLAVLAPVLAAVVVLDAPVRPLPVAAGAAGAVAVEALLSVRADRVRTAWERPAVQLAPALGTVAVAAIAVVAVGPVAATVLAAGLCAYLGLLAALTLLGR